MNTWGIYESVVKKSRFENLTVLRNDVVSGHKETLEKIDKYCDRLDYQRDVVIDKILSDDMFGFFFIKDPKKQNVYERTAVSMISNIPGVDKTKNLSNSVKKFYVNGALCESKKSESVKSVDVEISYKGRMFHIFHKYINAEGGAQDNQFNDVVSCMKNSIGNDVGVIFVCDGPFFDRRDRWSVLQQIQDKNTKCCNIFGLKEVLDGFFK